MFRRIISCCLFGLLLYPVYPASGQTWTLDDCVSYAMEHSIDIKRQEYAINKEHLSLQEGRWAFVPRLSASTSYTMSTGRVLDPTTYDFVRTNYTGNNSTSVSGELTLFEGGKKLHSLSKAKLSLKASFLNEESLKYNLRIQIAGAYLDILCAKEQERVANETVSLIESQLERTRSLYNAGSVTETDVLQLQTQLSAAKKDASSASYAFQMARLTLCDILEWEDYERFEVAELTSALPKVENWDIEAVLDNHPDIRSSAIFSDLAVIDYKLARSAVSPRLSLSAGFGTSFSDARQKMIMNDDGTLKYQAYPFLEQYADNRSAFVSLSLTIPILNGLSTRNGIRRARIATEETRLNEIETRKKIRRQLIQAKMDCSAAEDLYNHSVNEARFAEKVFRQVDRKYNLGAVDFNSWNIAAVDMAKAHYSLLEAKYTYLLRVEILNSY